MKVYEAKCYYIKIRFFVTFYSIHPYELTKTTEMLDRLKLFYGYKFDAEPSCHLQPLFFLTFREMVSFIFF